MIVQLSGTIENSVISESEPWIFFLVTCVQDHVQIYDRTFLHDSSFSWVLEAVLHTCNNNQGKIVSMLLFHKLLMYEHSVIIK